MRSWANLALEVLGFVAAIIFVVVVVLPAAVIFAAGYWCWEVVTGRVS